MNDIHPGDQVLNAILRRFPGLYEGRSRKIEGMLGSFLRPKYKALEKRENESSASYHRRLMAAFSGAKWAIVRRRIANEVTKANQEATDLVNDGLERAFVDGMNESAYALSLTGVEMAPITLAIVASLVVQGIITLNRRKLKKRKDISWNEERAQSAVNAAIAQDVPVKDMPAHISAHIARARQNESVSYAQAAIYGASDTGAYMAGLEAERLGLEVEKTWLSIMDMRVRPSHKHLHGVTIPLHEKFHGYHGVLRYPHDPDAPPQEIYRCRCRMAVHLAGKSPGEYSRRILPTQTTAYKEWRDAQIRRLGGELELEKLHKRLLRR